MSETNKKVQVIANIIMAAATILIPFILLFISSFTDSTEIALNGYSFFPKKWSMEAYAYIWKEKSQIFRAYFITIIVTAVGTTASLLITMMYAYALSKDYFPGKKFFSMFLLFTMLFNGGLVPTYMMYANTFHIKNTIFALIVPSLMMNAFYVIMMRSFFSSSIPDSLIEAARLDGASEIKILARVILPLSKPMVVTLVLMVGLGYWNDWMNGLYYVTEQKLYTIQMILNNMINNIEFLTRNASMLGTAASNMKIPQVGIRMGIAVIAVLPILIIYPFLQKYFVKGIVIGGVKG